jgi:alpha-1,2-mannosyltransferase
MDSPLISEFIKPLSECEWLDASRAKAYARVMLAIVFAGSIGWIALSSGGLDRQGKPIGTDFVGFYTASRFALADRPELAYDIGAHWAAQRALFGPKLGYTAFFYPPPALMIYLPLVPLQEVMTH